MLTQKLDDTATLIGKVALAVAIFAFFAMLFRYMIKYEFDIPNGDHFRDAVLDWLITVITIVVVAVPEGLPLAVRI